MTERNKKSVLLLIILAIIIWCTTIFRLSDMNPNSSNGASTGIVEKAISKVLDATNEAGITDSHPDNEKLTKAAELINAPLRKVVHATVYFVLALLLLTIGRVIFGDKKISAIMRDYYTTMFHLCHDRRISPNLRRQPHGTNDGCDD